MLISGNHDVFFSFFACCSQTSSVSVLFFFNNLLPPDGWRLYYLKWTFWDCITVNPAFHIWRHSALSSCWFAWALLKCTDPPPLSRSAVRKTSRLFDTTTGIAAVSTGGRGKHPARRQINEIGLTFKPPKCQSTKKAAFLCGLSEPADAFWHFPAISCTM